MPAKIRAQTSSVLFLLTSLVVLTAWAAGCGFQGEVQRKTMPLPGKGSGEMTQLPDDPTLVLGQRVKAAANTVPGVKDSTAVVMDKNISLAVKVQGFDRLRLNKIRSQVHHKVTKLAPEHEVHVTSDKKLFFELQKIEQQRQRENGPPAPALKTKLEQINTKMKG